MDQVAYSEINPKNLILRDRLAADRTILANERTFLSYLRTALTLFVTGASFIRFFNSLLFEIIGWIFIPIGLGMVIVGFRRFKKFEKNLSLLCLPTNALDMLIKNTNVTSGEEQIKRIENTEITP